MPKKNNNRIQNISSIWTLILLVSFFSSCTIRKGIQANFEIPVTKQLNPSKSVSNPKLVCHYTEASVKASVSFQETITGPGILHLNQESLVQQVNSIYKDKCAVTSGWPLTAKIESYILFRQMKSWINLQTQA